MAEEKLNAIVLKAVDYAEADKLLWLYSPERGKFSCIIKGVKKAAAKLKYAAMPFCFGEFLLAEKGGRSIVIGCTMYESFFGLRQDLQRFNCACAALETVQNLEAECAGQNQGQAQVFLLLLHTLQALISDENVPPELILIKFLLEYISLSGYLMSLERCNACLSEAKSVMFLDVAAGTIVCAACKSQSSFLIDAQTLGALRVIHSIPRERLSVVRLEQPVLREALSILDLYFTHCHIKLKSLKSVL